MGIGSIWQGLKETNRSKPEEPGSGEIRVVYRTGTVAEPLGGNFPERKRERILVHWCQGSHQVGDLYGCLREDFGRTWEKIAPLRAKCLGRILWSESPKVRPKVPMWGPPVWSMPWPLMITHKLGSRKNAEKAKGKRAQWVKPRNLDYGEPMWTRKRHRSKTKILQGFTLSTFVLI